jgi:putative spermidine/putrescine transport system ATP-binding protein
MTANITAGTAEGGGRSGHDGTGAGAPVVLRDLGRSFGSVRALGGLSLEIAPGEFVALLGPSGCGKTTALRIVAGFETADAGYVAVDGKDVSPVPAARRDMGMVFQSYSLFPNMSALDNVGFGLRMRKRRSGERNRRAGELLEMVGLTDHARKYPHQLSGGQQQRVALARALAIEPRVLLLDEPLSALDAKVRLQLREQIRLLQQRLGITTIFVTHDQEEALSMADRVGVMRDGQLEQVAEPSELYAHPATAFVAEFVGTMNRIPAGLLPAGQVRPIGSAAQGQDGAAPVVTGPVVTGSVVSGDVDMLVRPEELRIAAVPGGNGIVTDRTFLGSVTRVSVRLSGDVTVKVDLPSTGAAAMPPGTSVEVTLAGTPVLVAERR